MRKQFTFYESYFTAIQGIPKKSDRLAAYDALASYALHGEDTELTGIAAIVFELMKPTLDSAAKKAKLAKKDREFVKERDKFYVTEKEAQGCNKGESKKEKEIEIEIEPEIEIEIEIELEIEAEAETKIESDKEAFASAALSEEPARQAPPITQKKKPSRTALPPPTLKEIKEYCVERKNADAFSDSSLRSE